MRISMDKTGFLVSDRQVKAAFKQVLQEPEFKKGVYPKVQDAMKDLGVDTSLGRLRRTKVQRGRLTKGLRRAAKLRDLPSGKRVALVKSNVYPTALWGQHTQGLSKTTLHSFTVQIAAATRARHKLGCLTTALRLHMRIEDDPRHVVMKQQLEGWFSLLLAQPRHTQELIAKAWSVQHSVIWSKCFHWHYARGPMSATMCRLKDAGWVAPQLLEWHKDEETLRLQLEDPLLMLQLVQTVQERQESDLWKQASAHQGGRGAEHGLDFHVAKKHVQHLKKPNPDKLPALIAVLEGSLPSSQNGMRTACSKCGRNPTLKHLLWECEAVLEATSPTPSAWLEFVADCNVEVYWLRGLPPAFWTGRSKHPVEEDSQVDMSYVKKEGIFCQQNPLHIPGDSIVFGTDGSGGSSSRDRRIRVCTWSVVALDPVTEHVLGKLSGPLPGHIQTVPRAEGWAILMLLTFTSGNVQCCTDSLISVRRFRKLRYLHRKAFKFFSNPDLWVRVRQQAQDRRVKLFWIKSHQTAQVDLGLPRWAFRANQLADALAGEASSRVEESLQHSLDREYNSWLDSRTWRLQKLLLERASFWLQQGQLVSTKQFGPKAPSKLQILNHLSETHATHQWGPASASGQRACNGCGLAVSSKWAKQKLLWVASLPCFRAVTTFACWECTPATSFSEMPPAGGAEGASAGSDSARFSGEFPTGGG